MTSLETTRLEPSGVYVVIPVRNRKEYTLECLRSLARQTVTGFHTVIVDDGSTDGTREAVRAEFPDVILLEGDGNLWWTAATNLGAGLALDRGAQAVLCLNDDLQAADDYIGKMLEAARRMPQAVLASYMLDIRTREPYLAGGWMDWRRYKPILLLDTLPEAERHGCHPIALAVGTGLWAPAQVLRALDLFDARRLPHYGADCDFAFRAQERGFPLYANLDARLYCYTADSGQLEYTSTYSLRNWFRHLFGRKGGGNLWNLTVVVLRHCPKRHLALCWLRGVTNQVAGYPVKWVRQARRRRADRRNGIADRQELHANHRS